MRFSKWHGCGNDFVMLADPSAGLGPAGALSGPFVAALCDRHTGIGADGVIRVIGPEGDPETASAGADRRMDYYNADGGPAEMCGNGVRCVVLHERRAGRLTGDDARVLTGAGPVSVCVLPDERVRVDMGTPSTERADVPMSGRGSALGVSIDVDGHTVEGHGVSMGNPHVVVFTEPTDDVVADLGPQLERHVDFPERTNVEFAVVEAADRVRMRVWERGIGETMACGSGACAVLVAAAATGCSARCAAVELPGGILEVEWAADDHVWLTGPAEEVFRGEIDERWLAARRLEAFTPLVGSR